MPRMRRSLLAPLWWWALGLGWTDVGVQLLVAAIVFGVFVGAFAAGWMGGGDVKMIAAISLWLPLGSLVDMLMVMAVLGGAITVLMMIDQRRRRAFGTIEVPYGVAIAAAALLVLPAILPIDGPVPAAAKWRKPDLNHSAAMITVGSTTGDLKGPMRHG